MRAAGVPVLIAVLCGFDAAIPQNQENPFKRYSGGREVAAAAEERAFPATAASRIRWGLEGLRPLRKSYENVVLLNGDLGR